MKKINLFISVIISMIIIMGIAQFYSEESHNHDVNNNSNPVNNSTVNNNSNHIVTCNGKSSDVFYTQIENDHYEYGRYDNVFITSHNFTLTIDNIKNMSAYTAGYTDYPNNTTYDNISSYKQYNIQECMNETIPVVLYTNITAYCIGFDDARIDAENKEAEMRKNNATLEVEKRIEVNK